MRVVSWNIQAARGCDGRYSLSDIIAWLEAQKATVICLQEVARFLPESHHQDLLTALSQHFSHYTPVWAPGFSWSHDGAGRREFGNLTLVHTAQLSDARVHVLPTPMSSEHLQMPRTLVEVVVNEGTGAIRIFNTHLAFHSPQERRAQLDALGHYKSVAEQLAQRCIPAGSIGSYAPPPSPHKLLLCGDLNLTPHSHDYARLVAQGWIDSWLLCHTDLPHAATCGIFDRQQWPEGPHCRDFCFVNADAKAAITAFAVEPTCDASDHQPLILDFDLTR